MNLPHSDFTSGLGNVVTKLLTSLSVPQEIQRLHSHSIPCQFQQQLVSKEADRLELGVEEEQQAPQKTSSQIPPFITFRTVFLR